MSGLASPMRLGDRWTDNRSRGFDVRREQSRGYFGHESLAILTFMSESSVTKIDRAVWPLAAVVVVGSIMSILDTTIVNVALQTLSDDLDAPIATVQWVVTGYMLALAAVIPVTGWAARRVGTRRLYLASLVLFTLGSMLCGLAWSIDSLIVFRVLQGLGGGMLMPTGMIILARAAGPQQMGRMFSAIGVPMVLAPVFGPVLGGLLVEHVGWRWIFFVNLPVGIVAVALALRFLPLGPRRGSRAVRLARARPPLARPARRSPTGSPRPGAAPASARRKPSFRCSSALLLDRGLRRPLAALEPPAPQRPPLRQPRLRGRVGDDVLPRRDAVRRHDPAPALLPDRPPRLRRPDGPAARPAEPRRRLRRCRSRDGWPTASAAARSRSPA